MADHIKVDTNLLHDMSETLDRLKDQFDHADKVVDHYSGFLGSGRMADTLHEFATNWDVHKKDILSALEQMATVTKEAADAWDGLDRDLAKALTDAAKKDG